MQVENLERTEVLPEDGLALGDVLGVFDVALGLKAVCQGAPSVRRGRRRILVVGLFLPFDVVLDPLLENVRDLLLRLQLDQLWHLGEEDLQIIEINDHFLTVSPIDFWVVNHELVVAWLEELGECIMA